MASKQNNKKSNKGQNKGGSLSTKNIKEQKEEKTVSTKNTSSKKTNKPVYVNNKKKEEDSYELSLRTKIYTVVGIICVFLVFYIITVYVTGNNVTKSDEEEEETVSISYDEIILGRSLSMGKEEYLVVFYDGSNEELVEDYGNMIRDYRNKEEHLPIYVVNMSKIYNSRFETTEESNKNPDTTANMRINGPTLIRVIDEKVVEYLEGKDAISGVLA